MELVARLPRVARAELPPQAQAVQVVLPQLVARAEQLLRASAE